MKTMKKTYVKPNVTVIDAYSEEIMAGTVATISANVTSLEVSFNNATNSFDDVPGIDTSGSTTDVSGIRGNDIWDDWDE